MPTIYTTPATELPPKRTQNHYPTEQALITAALRLARDEFLGYFTANSILDAGAGNDGRWGLAAKAEFNPSAYLVGVELRPVIKPVGYDYWHNGDFLQFTAQTPFDLIVSNPPYAGKTKPPLGERFIQHAWGLLAPMGAMIFLLPLDYLVGQGRYFGFFRDIPPIAALPVVRRVDFSGDTNGGTNNHCVFIWRKWDKGQSVGIKNQFPVTQLWYDR